MLIYTLDIDKTTGCYEFQSYCAKRRFLSLKSSFALPFVILKLQINRYEELLDIFLKKKIIRSVRSSRI